MESKFRTNEMFSGGSGIFLQYHDVIRSVWLMVVLRMLLTGESMGFPVSFLSKYTVIGAAEWYLNRTCPNVLQTLDFKSKADPSDLDTWLQQLLRDDPSLYSHAPTLNAVQMLQVYQTQHMDVPVYVYSPNEEPEIENDVKRLFPTIPIQYVYGPLETCLKRCNENFTYIFSDIELAHRAMMVLHSMYSHILIARDYRYNFTTPDTMKYELGQLQKSNPTIRISTTSIVDRVSFVSQIRDLLKQS